MGIKLSLTEKLNLIKHIIESSNFKVFGDRLVIDTVCRNFDNEEVMNDLKVICQFCQFLNTKPDSFLRISFSKDGKLSVYDCYNNDLISMLIPNKEMKPFEYFLFTDLNGMSYLIDIEQHL